MGVTEFVSEIKRVKNYRDLKKMAHLNSILYTWLIVKNIYVSKISRQGQTILLIFCKSASVT